MRAVSLLGAMSLSFLLGCAHSRPQLPADIVLRHMVCQRDPEAQSPSIAVCHCKNPYIAFNAKTGKSEIFCQAQ